MPPLSRNWSFATFFTLLYALLLAWLIQYHELWFDETEPWLLALYSDSYAELLQNKVYEGHPNLWYSLLFIVTRFTHDLLALQTAQLVFAVGFVFVFLRYAPFHWLLRVLFCFGYYGLFEYGTISRLYALELFTTFLICTLYTKRFSHWYLFLLVLVLNAQTHLFGLFFTGVLGLLLFSEAFGFWKDAQQLPAIPPLKKWMGLGLWAAGSLYSLYSIIRPSEGELVMLNLRSVTRPWQAFFPIPHFFVDFWNSYILTPTLLGYACEAILSVAIVTFVLRCFLPVKRLFLPLLGLFVLLAVFFAFKYMGSIRHFGHYFVFTLAFGWQLSYYQDTSALALISFKRLQQLLFLATFIQFGVGIHAVATDIRHPFHPAKQTAAYLKAKVPSTDLIALEDDIILSSVVAYYGKPILYLPTLTPSTFFQPDTPEENELTLYQLLDWAQALAQKENRRVVLVSSQEIDLNWYPYPVKLLSWLEEPNITHHFFYLYQIGPAPFPKADFVAGTPQDALRANPAK
ncbi:hypothetical protein [Rufibacter roseolus]|uniref:hypothetical protein n=1 Tax=Rufibacter roseolus TaxID=2817375 RepID=UPI001B303D55|nr:hypothetical protein [Rufibacter roseolus]